MTALDKLSPRRQWLVALSFVALWHGLLQLVAHQWLGIAPRPGGLALDLLAHLALGAGWFALARRLSLFLPAVALLLALVHLANAAKVAVLGAPIMPDDVAALRSLYLVLEGWQRVAAIAVLVLTALLLAAVLRPSRGGAQAALAALGPVALALWLAPASLASGLDRWVGNRVWDQRYNFETRGLVVHLVQETARYRARGEPPPTLQEVAEVVARLWPARAMEVALSADAHAARRNVHMIVLESFWDVRELAGAGLSEDPMDPRLRLLWEAGGAARALSPVFGGYTANAEFEALCGFPVSGDAVVFEGRLRRDAPCLPRHLAEAGYVTVASHPNVAAFWNRVHAYRRSGFQLYWSERDFELDDMNREMLSDASLYRQVLERIRPLIEAGAPVFNYVLTFSGHLDYPLGPARPPVVEARSAESLVRPYANNVFYKSRELMDFLAALREVDPDGIVIVFGDHLPFLGYEYAAYVESGLLAPERSRFIDTMFLTQVATPLLVLNGREGPVATGDLPIYRLPGLVLELLGDARPSPLTLTGTPPGLAVRPLPGMSLVVSADGPRACRPVIDDDPGCEEAAAWLAAVGTLARDLFAGRQYTLRSPMGAAREEPDPL